MKRILAHGRAYSANAAWILILLVGFVLIVGNRPVIAQSTPTLSIANTTGAPDTIVPVAVSLDSSGGITGMTFSLFFDPTKFSIDGTSGIDANPDVDPGVNLPAGATIVTNATQTPSGWIGVFLNTTTPIAPGLQQVLVFNFRVLPGTAPGTYPINFDQQPITSSMSASGVNVPATYVNGSITITATGPGDGPGFEGDIDGDSNVTVIDEQLLLSYLRGDLCPPLSRHQVTDVGPRTDANANLVRGDGRLGSADSTVMTNYVAQIPGSPSDFSVAPGYQLTPAGGPTAFTNLLCTPPPFIAENGRFSLASYKPNAVDATSFRLVPVSGARGSIVELLVEMSADGVEAGTQFSIHFDPAVASISSASGFGPTANPDITFGNGVAPATTTMSVNAFDAANGNVGIAFNFNATNEGTVVPQGTKSIARLTLHIKNDAPFGDSPVTFTSTPLVRVTSTLAGTSKTAIYFSGTLTVAAPEGPAVNVGGRVVTPSGAPVSRANITLTDTTTGEQRSVLTTQMGFFTFSGVAGGKTYTVSATSKRYRFQQKTLTNLSSDLSDVNFTGLE